MSAELDRSVIGTILNTYSQTSGFPVAWPNRDFQPPQKATWLRVTIRGVQANRLEIGSLRNTHRYSHVLIVQVFVPANSGDLVARQVSQEIANLFRGQSVNVTEGTVRFKTPTISDVGESGAWYQMNVSVPFDSDYYQ